MESCIVCRMMIACVERRREAKKHQCVEGVSAASRPVGSYEGLRLAMGMAWLLRQDFIARQELFRYLRGAFLA